jgi:hypothetical protein
MFDFPFVGLRATLSSSSSFRQGVSPVEPGFDATAGLFWPSHLQIFVSLTMGPFFRVTSQPGGHSMKRILVALITTSVLMGVASAGFALSTAGIEEAFVDSVGTCGPSSKIAGMLGASNDPEVKIALRNALIIEAADDAAVVAGSNKEHSDCIRKELKARGYSENDMEALPYCVKNDWPSPFTSLGVCVQSHSRLEAAMKMK